MNREISGTSMLGLVVQVRRRQRGWSLNRLARESGIDKGVLSRLEAGLTRRLASENVAKLARTLEIEPDVLQELGLRPAAPMSDQAAEAVAVVNQQSAMRSGNEEPELQQTEGAPEELEVIKTLGQMEEAMRRLRAQLPQIQNADLCNKLAAKALDTIEHSRASLEGYTSAREKPADTDQGTQPGSIEVSPETLQEGAAKLGERLRCSKNASERRQIVLKLADLAEYACETRTLTELILQGAMTAVNEILEGARTEERDQHVLAALDSTLLQVNQSQASIARDLPAALRDLGSRMEIPETATAPQVSDVAVFQASLMHEIDSIPDDRLERMGFTSQEVQRVTEQWCAQWASVTRSGSSRKSFRQRTKLRDKAGRRNG